MYRHVWVTLSAIARHKNLRTVGLPLLARMYVKAKDIKNVGLSFKSKTEWAADLAKWAYVSCKNLGKQLWIVTDGGFTRASFLKPVIEVGAVAVTPLRKDAELYAEPNPSRKRNRGRPRKYGKRVKLTNGVTHPDGWFMTKVLLYGKQEIKEVKLFTQQVRHVLWLCEDQDIKPRFFLRDNDVLYPDTMNAILKSSGVSTVKTPYQAPNANSHSEWNVLRGKREWLNHLLIYGLNRLQDVLDSHTSYFNEHYPHQWIGNRIPAEYNVKHKRQGGHLPNVKPENMI